MKQRWVLHCANQGSNSVQMAYIFYIFYDMYHYTCGTMTCICAVRLQVQSLIFILRHG